MSIPLNYFVINHRKQLKKSISFAMAENEIISSSDMHFFEGVEKLLEIWFAPPNQNSADLRKIPRLVQVIIFLKRCSEWCINDRSLSFLYKLLLVLLLLCSRIFHNFRKIVALSNQKNSRKLIPFFLHLPSHFV